MSEELEKLSQAEHLLARIETVTDAKNVADLAAAWQALVKRRYEGRTDYFNKGTKVQALAYRDMARLVDEGQERGEIAKQSDGLNRYGVAQRDTIPATLRDLGTDKREVYKAREIAELTKEEILELVDEYNASDEELTCKDLQRLVRKRHRAERVVPPIPEGRFSVIYADPPWPVDSMVLDKWESPLDDKYQTMSVESIKALGGQIGQITAEDCSIFLWTTHTFLREGLDVLEEWGFSYHCCITWDKGSGWSLCGFHRRTEFCLYGYKGKINVSQSGLFIPTLVYEQARQHSRKPDIMYELIEGHTPAPRIELFSRSQRDGWVMWGDQAP